MITNENELSANSDFYEIDYSLEELEKTLEDDLEASFEDLEILKEDRAKISNPDSLGETVMNVVWEQFINQVGAVAGEEFIKENRGLKLDLRNSAHIQTTDNFAQGKIASHNDKIDYQDRYDKWQAKFQHDENGNIVTYTDRSGKPKARLAGSHVRKPFDEGRPTGSMDKGTDMDHTISAAEIIRDQHANAHLTESEQIEFANSKANLNEMNSSHNRSKSDMAMSEWLDNPNKNGQKPDEIFDDLDAELKEKYRQKDKEAREEYERVKKDGEKKSIETGKQSQKEEAIRMGKHALKGIVMGLLIELLKTIFQKFVVWLKAKSKSFSTFIEHMKEAIHKFIYDLKTHIKAGIQSGIGAIASMIFGPIVRALQKAWTFLKQGYKSIKEAIEYIRNPENMKKDFSILVLEVGKIIIAGLTAAGAIALSGAIEGSLSSIPFFAFEIPLLGSLASILGIFLGAVISGIIGALVIRLIDQRIAKKQKEIKTGEIIHQKNKVLDVQNQLLAVSVIRLENTKATTASEIISRHQEAASITKSKIEEIDSDLNEIYDQSYLMDIKPSSNSSALDDLIAEIDSL